MREREGGNKGERKGGERGEGMEGDREGRKGTEDEGGGELRS